MRKFIRLALTVFTTITCHASDAASMTKADLFTVRPDVTTRAELTAKYHLDGQNSNFCHVNPETARTSLLMGESCDTPFISIDFGRYPGDPDFMGTFYFFTDGRLAEIKVMLIPSASNTFRNITRIPLLTPEQTVDIYWKLVADIRRTGYNLTQSQERDTISNTVISNGMSYRVFLDASDRSNPTIEINIIGKEALARQHG